MVRGYFETVFGVRTGVNTVGPTNGAGDWPCGGIGGFDIRTSENGNSFKQISGGLEALSANWDFRVNGYYPLEDWLDWIEPVNEAGDRYDHEVRVFLGAYYFEHSLFSEPIWGPRLRTEWRINDFLDALPGSRLTLEAEAQYDDVRKDQFEIGLRLRIPLGAPDNYSRSLSAQSARMMEALERDTDIVTRTSSTAGGTTTSVTSVNLSTTLEPVDDPATSVELN